MRSAWLSAGLLALALAVAGCGGDGGKAATVTTPTVATATAVPPGPPVRDAPVADGRRVFEQSGCLACHQLFTQGNSGPGNNLAGIGSRLSPAEIRHALLDAKAPMPDFGDLPRDDLDDLVAYLSALKGHQPGDIPCPDEIDCG